MTAQTELESPLNLATLLLSARLITGLVVLSGGWDSFLRIHVPDRPRDDWGKICLHAIFCR